MEQKNILIASIGGIGGAIALLIILILIFGEPTYLQIIYTSRAKMNSIKEFQVVYDLSLGYEMPTGVEEFRGVANYTKFDGGILWNFTIEDEIGTIYEISPEELLDIMETLDGKYVTTRTIINECYEIDAIENSSASIIIKNERHLSGYDHLMISTCLDKETGYPIEYTIAVYNSITDRSGMAMYKPKVRTGLSPYE
jgi:hypothetical protein